MKQPIAWIGVLAVVLTLGTPTQTEAKWAGVRISGKIAFKWTVRGRKVGVRSGRSTYWLSAPKRNETLLHRLRHLPRDTYVRLYCDQVRDGRTVRLVPVAIESARPADQRVIAVIGDKGTLEQGSRVHRVTVLPVRSQPNERLTADQRPLLKLLEGKRVEALMTVLQDRLAKPATVFVDKVKARAASSVQVRVSPAAETARRGELPAGTVLWVSRVIGAYASVSYRKPGERTIAVGWVEHTKLRFEAPQEEPTKQPKKAVKRDAKKKGAGGRLEEASKQ